MNESVVLITGGSTVIGSAAAVAFAKKDARMVAAGRRDEAGKALVKELRSLGLEAPKMQNDVDCARAALALVPDATPTKK